MRKYIDQLLMDGKEEEAIPLIEEVWRKEAGEEQKKIADLSRRIDVLEKRKESMSDIT